MKGNVFQIWLKEFIALVFTQTLQAFIMAVILSIIVIVYNNSTGIDEDVTMSAGVLSVIALASVSKIEVLVKKIFGIDSSVTDTSMNGGKGGLLATFAAGHLAGRFLNDIPQIGKGISGVAKGAIDKSKAKKDYLTGVKKKVERYDSLHGADAEGNGGSTGAGGTGRGTGAGGIGGSAGAGAGAGGIGGSGSGTGGGTGDGRLNGGSITITNSTVNMSGNGNNVKGENDSKAGLKDKFKLEDDLEELKAQYESKRKEATLNQFRAAGTGIKGTAELVSAFPGAAAGAVVSAAMGTDILKGAASGVGVSDYIVGGAADLAGTAIKTGYHTVDGVSSLSKNSKASKDAINKINAIKSRNAEIEEALKKFNAGDI